MKLDRLLGKHAAMGRKTAREAIAAGKVRVGGEVVRRVDSEVNRFQSVEIERQVVRDSERALYLMLHKPIGVVSATVDAAHRTVVDLIDDPDKASLHLVGRLDRNTSGLMLLTNDGRWSKALMDPARKVPKVYRVKTRDPIPSTAVAAFAAGFYFHTEDLTTAPAELAITGEREARLTLFEGRYHQVKRMFHRIGNRVTGLHRESVGSLELGDLKESEWRPLNATEVQEAGRVGAGFEDPIF